jgi:hypothetical protein
MLMARVNLLSTLSAARNGTSETSVDQQASLA